jgi:hypothetical protein
MDADPHYRRYARACAHDGPNRKVRPSASIWIVRWRPLENGLMAIATDKRILR